MMSPILVPRRRVVPTGGPEMNLLADGVYIGGGFFVLLLIVILIVLILR